MARRFPDSIFAHWSKLIENFQVTPSQFYDLLVKAIKQRNIPDTTIESVLWSEGGVFTAKREYLRVRRNEYTYDICGAPFGTGFFISSWLIRSPKNLLIAFGTLLALLFGTFILWAIFFSIFLAIPLPTAIRVAGSIVGILMYPLIVIAVGIAIRQGIIPIEQTILDIPLFGYLYTLIFQPITYYRIDSMIVFHEMMHSVLMQAVEELTKEKGLFVLTESDRKPILKDVQPGLNAAQQDTVQR